MCWLLQLITRPAVLRIRVLRICIFELLLICEKTQIYVGKLAFVDLTIYRTIALNALEEKSFAERNLENVLNILKIFQEMGS